MSVLTAASGVEALEILRRVDIDFIVSDLAMPEMNGIAFMKEVRRLPGARERSTPAIAYSASSQLERAARDAGFDAVLAKPLDPLVLLREIRRLVVPRRGS